MEKCQDMTQPKLLQLLTDKGLKYNGSNVNRRMMLAAQSLAGYMAQNPALERVLVSVQMEFGRDVWSSGYNKIGRVMQIVSKATALWNNPDLSVEFVLEFVLQYSLGMLRRGTVQPKFFSSTAIENGEGGGWTIATCVKAYLASYIMKIATTAAEKEAAMLGRATGPTPKKDTKEAIEKVWLPLLFHKNCPPSQEDQCEGVADLEEAEDSVTTEVLPEHTDTVSEDSLAAITASLPKAGKQAVELLHDLFEAEHENQLKKTVSESDPAKCLLENTESKNELAKIFRSMVAGLCAGTVSIGSADPPVSIRQLARQHSNPEEPKHETTVSEEERKETWASAQAVRKKRCQLILWTGKSPESLRTLLDKCQASAFEGKINESHRLWVFSSDLALEAKGSWQRTPALVPDSVTAVFQCLEKYPMKEHDIVLCFDGCAPDNKSVLRQGLGDSAKLNEFVLLYSSRPREARHRKIFCAAAKVEVAVMKLHVPKVRFAVKTRTDDYMPPTVSASGSKKNAKKLTTHDLTMVGLPAVSGRPLMPSMEKAKAFDCDEPPKFRGSACPVFWAESKSAEVWETLLEVLNIGSVIDLTAGSGCLASVCLSSDIAYVGVTRNQVHHSWLVNVMDRESLRLLADSNLKENWNIVKLTLSNYCQLIPSRSSGLKQ